MKVSGGRLALVLAEHAWTKVDYRVCHCGLVGLLLLVVGYCRRAVDGMVVQEGLGGGWTIGYGEKVVWCRRDGDVRERGG
jgi:hypothetical protein